MNKDKVISMPAIDEGKYRGEWLALDPQTREVLAHGTVLGDVAMEAKNKGCNEPIFHGVPKSDIHFVTIE